MCSRGREANGTLQPSPHTPPPLHWLKNYVSKNQTDWFHWNCAHAGFRPRGSSAISNPESGNSILLGTGASPPESGNRILDQNTIKREVAFMGAIPCGRNSTVTM